MTLSDPASDASAIYYIALGGGSGSHIVTEQAIHGCISIWDVRHPLTNWSGSAINGLGSASAQVYTSAPLRGAPSMVWVPPLEWAKAGQNTGVSRSIDESLTDASIGNSAGLSQIASGIGPRCHRV